MTHRNILKESERTLDEAIIELTFGRYDVAEQKFGAVVDDLNDKMCRTRYDRSYSRYFRAAAFGQGLAQGMKEYDGSNNSGEPRPVWQVAEAAKNFYDAQNIYLVVENYMEHNYKKYYTNLGKQYAILGLSSEGLKVLEDSRHGSQLLLKLIGPQRPEQMNSECNQQMTEEVINMIKSRNNR